MRRPGAAQRRDVEGGGTVPDVRDVDSRVLGALGPVAVATGRGGGSDAEAQPAAPTVVANTVQPHFGTRLRRMAPALLIALVVSTGKPDGWFPLGASSHSVRAGRIAA